MYDIIVRNGSVYDGGGGEPTRLDVAIVDEEIAAIGELADEEAGEIIDATDHAVAPGFVNMLSHSYFSILKDPRSMSELKQGVTTQVFGEGFSMGPLTDEGRRYIAQIVGKELDLSWDRLSEYLAHVESEGTSQNVASFIGSWNPRMYVLGTEDRKPTRVALDRMCGLVEEEMADGALGIASALIYPPGSFATTEELIALCQTAGRYGGIYISHMRSEGNELLESVDELLRISREAEIPAEIYHLKAAGRHNWHKMDAVIARVEEARDRGYRITADLYPYRAGSTALFSIVPPRFRSGPIEQHVARLKDARTREEILSAIAVRGEGWENLWEACGGAEGIVLLRTRDDGLAPYRGRTLAAIAEEIGNHDPLATALRLLERDPSIGAAFFLASEENLKRQVQLPWVSFGSDAASIAPEEPFLEDVPHPRTYGTFARILGRYVREERLIDLREAVRRLTSLPAETLGLDRRGRLKPGWYADITVFDPETIADRATYRDPHRYALGVKDVIVNGRVVLRDGEHAGVFPGRALSGPGKRR